MRRTCIMQVSGPLTGDTLADTVAFTYGFLDCRLNWAIVMPAQGVIHSK